MKRTLFLLAILFTMVFSAACGSVQPTEATTISDQSTTVLVDDQTETAVTDETTRPAGWREETHSKTADPNYDVVFPDDEVNTMTITIDPDDWQAMLDDMTATYGELGSGGGQFGPGNDAVAPAGGPPAGGPPAGGPPAGGPPNMAQDAPTGDFTTENPIWVAADITFEGDIWTDVGVRFKGNSSLMNTWSSGSLELPFKLDFDEFEDENPAIDDQRFYGFKQLSLSNNTNDTTFMRDAVTSDILADAGIASAKTAFYELFVDYGEGPVSFGLYTMIEVVDDTVIDRVFGNDDGNIYEADGTAVSLAAGTFDNLSTSFIKENNEDAADWSDIEALYTALHADSRQTDPAAWKAEMEAVFDVDTFLHWLAINTVIENWDTYGAMTHNFYLYNNPETGLLTWIPWDHNEALSESKRGSMTLDMAAIGDDWPLISYLLADSDYYDTYVGYVSETISTVFEPDAMVEKYAEIASLIEPYAAADIGADAFAQSLQTLIDHTYTQVSEAEAFLLQVGE